MPTPKEVTNIREHNTHSIDYRGGEKGVSHSQLVKYHTCKMSWYKDKVLKEAPYIPSIHAVFGQSLHEVMQDCLKVLYTKAIRESESMDLSKMLHDRMMHNYQENKEKHGKHFSTARELRDFYYQGCSILSFVKKKRAKYFSKKNSYLVGVEVPVVFEVKKDFYFNGFLDLVFYDNSTEKYKIVDIKTSTSGWSKWARNDEKKRNQILLYKSYFSKQFDVPLDKIDVEFFIVRREIPEDVDFPIKPVSQFLPPNGKPSINKAERFLQTFLDNALDSDGNYVEQTEYSPSVHNCRFCPFKDTCDKAIR